MPTRPPTHQPAHGGAAETRKAHDRWRGSAHSRGYDHDWRKARVIHLQEHPLCWWCQQAGRITAATVVDHIQPIAARPDLRLDPANFRSGCESCHNAHTARQVADGHVGAVGAMRRTRG